MKSRSVVIMLVVLILVFSCLIVYVSFFKSKNINLIDSVSTPSTKKPNIVENDKPVNSDIQKVWSIKDGSNETVYEISGYVSKEPYIESNKYYYISLKLEDGLITTFRLGLLDDKISINWRNSIKSSNNYVTGTVAELINHLKINEHISVQIVTSTNTKLSDIKNCDTQCNRLYNDISNYGAKVEKLLLERSSENQEIKNINLLLVKSAIKY